MDRLITITFPLKFRKFKMRNAVIIMGLLWIICIALSALPLMKLNYFDNFYGRSGVCLALHITQDRPNGWEYSVFVFLVLNFISFTIIAIAYTWMFFVAKNTTNAVRTQEHKVHNRMARRMMFIVMTDFCCWMPIILLGIISFYGVQIPPQVFILITYYAFFLLWNNFDSLNTINIILSVILLSGIRMGCSVCIASQCSGQSNSIYSFNSCIPKVKQYSDNCFIQ